MTEQTKTPLIDFQAARVHAKTSIDIGERLGFRDGTNAQVNAYRALLAQSALLADMREALRHSTEALEIAGGLLPTAAQIARDNRSVLARAADIGGA